MCESILSLGANAVWKGTIGTLTFVAAVVVTAVAVGTAISIVQSKGAVWKWAAWIRRNGVGIRCVWWTVWAVDTVVVGLKKSFCAVVCPEVEVNDGWTTELAVETGMKLAEKTKCEANACTTVFKDKFHETGLKFSIPDLKNSEFRLFSNSFTLGIMLQKKLCIQTLHQRNPEVSKVKLPRPVFIVSLPRTGSTWLHNVCNLDPTARTMKCWELHFPTSCNVETGPSVEERKAFMKKALNVLYSVAPRFKTIHHVRFDEPDECVKGFLDGFFPEHFAWGLVDMPHTYDYYTTHGVFQQYANYKKFLQARLYEAEQLEPGSLAKFDKLVLKSPHHLLALKDIAKVFPDAIVLWLHRNPTKVVGSCCSMNQAVLDYSYPWYYENSALGARTLARLSRATEIGQEHRDALETDPNCAVKFVDLYLNDLKKDPVNVLRKAYESAGLPFSEEFAERITQSLSQTEEETGESSTMLGTAAPAHAYTLQEFGFSDDEQILGAFEDYMQRYFTKSES